MVPHRAQVASQRHRHQWDDTQILPQLCKLEVDTSSTVQNLLSLLMFRLLLLDLYKLWHTCTHPCSFHVSDFLCQAISKVHLGYSVITHFLLLASGVMQNKIQNVIFPIVLKFCMEVICCCYFCCCQVLVVIDAKPKDLGLPTEAYIAVEEVHDVSTPIFPYSCLHQVVSML